MASARVWHQVGLGQWEYRPNGVAVARIQRASDVYDWSTKTANGTAPHYSEAQDAVRKALREQQPQPMDADTYQRLAARTLIDEPDTTFTNEELAIMLAALELGAAVGKVLEYVKKGICHRHGYQFSVLGRYLTEVSKSTSALMIADVHDKRIHALSGNEQMLIWCALGLGGEAGEVMDIVSSLPHTGDADDDPFDVLVKELGDNDWYNAALCTLLGVQMSTVMQANIDKLMKRFPEGWGSEASKARVDTRD
jgi:NTP pyrophosphatase (non-canonical NTP hydrolase)